MKIVIRAGGTGTRLWPLSRSDRPKQFLPLFDGERSCVQVAFNRFVGSRLVQPEDVYVSVGAAHYQLAHRQLPELPPENIIVEPAKMDTAAAIALETVVVAGNDPDVTIASLGSDHYVGTPRQFVESLSSAKKFLAHNPEKLLAIACKPVRVETGYGHIKMGDPIGEYEGRAFHEALEFTEKPDYEKAKKYTESGQYLWNSNFFAWKSGPLMRQFREFEPDIYEPFEQILRYRETGEFGEKLRQIYPTVKKTAIDYAVAEPAAAAGRLAVLPVSMQWSDIGSWASITDAFPTDENGNLFQAPVNDVDTNDSVVVSKNSRRKMIAMLGVEEMVVVDTEDALLVLPKERAGEVKELVEKLKNDPDCQSLI